MKTLFDKVWDSHIVVQEEDETLLYVDRCLIHEGSRHTFDTLHERGLAVAHPDKVFAFSDHYECAEQTHERRDRGERAGSEAAVRCACG
jgi:homoaconitase/3-isopropylmalate dehydratase large subunit